MIRKNLDLRQLNTFGISASAKYYAAFDTVSELRQLLAEFNDETKLVLGGGSNILFTKDVEGLVLHNKIDTIDIAGEDDNFVWVKAGAGVPWHQMVQYCVERNFGGIENLSLIPGSVGAAPMQNIGAYGVEIKDIFWELEAMDVAEKSIRIFSNEACEFGYRESIFKNQLKGKYIILSVTCRLRKRPVFNTSYGAIESELAAMGVHTLSVKAISDAVIRIRSAKLPDPAVIGNAGSFFKNPVIAPALFQQLQNSFPGIPFYKGAAGIKIPAAWLIEQCGLKGMRIGNVGCYKNQPLVIVNYGNASGEEIFGFSERIIEVVQARFGIQLHREVNIY